MPALSENTQYDKIGDNDNQHPSWEPWWLPDPSALTEFAGSQRWVAWQIEPPKPGAEPTKIPKNPATGKNARIPTDPKTYGTRQAAEQRWSKIEKHDAEAIGGIGIVLGAIENDDVILIGIDLDSCRDPKTGEISEIAQDVIERFDSYTEISPSGAGIKIYAALSPVDHMALLAMLVVEGEQRTRKTFAAGKHREIAIDTVRFYAVTEKCLGHRDVRTVSITDVRWLLDELGPRYLKEQRGLNGNGAANGHSPKVDADPYHKLTEDMKPVNGDQTRSGAAFRFCCDLIRYHDDMKYETALERMLKDRGEVGDWAREQKRNGNKRELERVYNNASARIMKEEKSDETPTGGTPLFDPWETTNVPSFPKGILPPAMEDFAEKAADNMGVDSAAMAMGILTTISGAINHQSTLKMKKYGDFIMTACFWGLLVGDSATTKSPIFKTVMGPLERKDAELSTGYRKLWAEYKELTPKEQKEEEPPPKPPQYVIYDTTPEKFGEVMAANPKGLILKRDEFSGFIAEMERDGGTSRGANASRSLWLMARDSVRWGMGRISRDTADVIPNLSCSIFAGVQLKKLAEIRGMTSDGLLQRFVPVLMQLSGKMDRDDCEVDITAYDNLIRQIVRLNENSIHHFELRDEAYTRMREIHQELFEIRRVADGISDGFIDFLGKLRGIAGNLTLILHYAYHPDHFSPIIEASTVERVDRLIFEFILPHAVAFYRSLAQKSVNGDTLQKVASWILTGKIENFTAANLTANVIDFRGLGPFDINRRLGPLVSTGWIKPRSPTPDNNKWTVPKRVHDEFAARTEEEERRKQKLATLMGGPRHPK